MLSASKVNLVKLSKEWNSSSLAPKAYCFIIDSWIISGVGYSKKWVKWGHVGQKHRIKSITATFYEKLDYLNVSV